MNSETNIDSLPAGRHRETVHKNGFIRELVKNRLLFLLLLPGTILLILNNYLPMAGLVIAFQRTNYRKGIFNGDWVGFKNFEFFFNSNKALIVTRNTVLYNLAFIVVGLVIALFFAVSLNELRSRLASKFYQSVLFLPYFMSWVVISYIVFALLGSDYGFVDKSLLGALGLKSVPWYTKTQYWPFILIFVNTWHTVGYSCVVYLAAITNLDAEYYEAAYIDGAGKVQQIFRITIPLLKPIIIIMTLMAVGRIFNTDIGLFYTVTMDSGALYNVTSTIDTYVYKTMTSGIGDLNMAAASGFYQSIVGFVFVFATNLLVRKLDPDSALF